MDRHELERLTVSTEPLTEHDGRSGTLLQRVRLSDGRSLVVKRFDPRSDLACRLLGDVEGVELRLLADGVLDALGPDVAHCLVGGWTEERTVVLVMRDLGPAMFTWNDVLSGEQTEQMIRAVASMHARFHGSTVAGLADLASVVTLFAPNRIEPFLAEHSLMRSAWDGWSRFADLAPREVAAEVLDLLGDPTRYLTALAALPPTLIHGDLATVNMALEDHRLTIIDWGMATVGPAGLDLGRLLANADGLLGVGRDQVIARYLAAVGSKCDEREIRLGLLGGVLWLGWNMALNATTGNEGRNALRWWTDQAGRALERDL